ncbi:Plasmodium vivax Vir protein, putative [Plasmodium vivax]|nr:Plasmodium vivax Vir protein, putative [Plasmodium vivax]
MNCSPDYDFFNNIDKYITEVKKIENPTLPNTSLVDCKHFSKQHDLGNIEKAEIMCNNFARINKLLEAIKTEVPNHCKFLNYWFNSELSENWFSENNCISYVYNGLESHVQSNDEYNLLHCEYYDINKDELNKIKLLYSLYEKYTDISTILENKTSEDKKTLLSLSTACCPYYIDANYICNPTNNTSTFCKKLSNFRTQYEDLYQKFKAQRSDISDNFIKLEECPNTKIISTAVTGTVVGLIPLMGVLYKFTPMGQMFRSKIGILNKDISNNDEEMIKMSLMEKENEPIRFQKGTYNIKYQSL